MSFLNDTSYSNYYEVLDVDSYATQEQIIKAYIDTKKVYSPHNKNLSEFFNKSELEELLRMIDEAFYILGDEESRKDYDSRIFGKKKKQSVEQMRKMRSLNQLQTKSNDSVSPSQKISDSKKLDNDNIAKTKVSEYELNSEFENKIKNQEIFDGTFLSKVRKYKNISLDQMSQSTKITHNYLLAIESNDYESLPAAVFVRSYIKHMANVLDLDPEKVSKSYMSLFK